MKKNEKYLVSPFCEAQYPYLNEPDTEFDEAGKYKVNLVLDPENPEHKKYLENLEKMAADKYGDDAHVPIGDHKNQDGVLTGLKVVKFSSNYPPKLYDRRNKPSEARVGAGSIAQVSAKPNFYKGIAGRSGLNLYLSAVKVRELVEPSAGTAEAFGFGLEPEFAEEVSPFDGEPETVGEEQENIPF